MVTGIRLRPSFWLGVILLTAVCLRLYDLANTPPGLTHDEADHGITAVDILNGTGGIYFTIGHGREPFFDYATAVLMAGIGPTYLALRLVAVCFSLIMLAGMFAWVRHAYQATIALLTTAGLGVDFWAVMAGRQALRSITLPALFVLVIFFFWRGLQRVEACRTDRHPVSSFAIAGLLLGLSFYTYIPARALWLVFPALLLYLFVVNRSLFRRVWPGMLMMLLVAALIGLPLLLYLQANPTVEIRIQELSQPLMSAAKGDFHPLWGNVIAGLQIFTITGDSAWRYNLPGRPLLSPVLGVLFYIGLLVAIWQMIRPGKKKTLRAAASFLALAWLVTGLAPVLVTGPELSMTQAMGMQPVLYLFPALALAQGARWAALLEQRLETGDWRLGPYAVVVPLLLYGGTAVITARDYFVRWANAPEVRVQYESTMTEAVRYVNTHPAPATAVSTITPGPFHTPALAQMMWQQETVTPRWFDGRSSLLIPQGEGVIIFSGFAPLHDALHRYFETAVLIDSLPLRETDLDRPLLIYRSDSAVFVSAWQHQFKSQLGDITAPAVVGDVAEFLGYDLQTPVISPGETVQLATLWQVQQPVANARFFAHVSDPVGEPFAQVDLLGTPGEAWVAGDYLVQYHEFALPPETAAGRYPITIGMYTCIDETCRANQRFLIRIDGALKGDSLYIDDLIVAE